MSKKRIKLEAEPVKKQILKLKTTSAVYSDAHNKAFVVNRVRGKVSEHDIMTITRLNMCDILTDFETMQKALRKLGVKAKIGPHDNPAEIKAIKKMAKLLAKDVPAFLKKQRG